MFGNSFPHSTRGTWVHTKTGKKENSISVVATSKSKQLSRLLGSRRDLPSDLAFKALSSNVIFSWRSCEVWRGYDRRVGLLGIEIAWTTLPEVQRILVGVVWCPSILKCKCSYVFVNQPWWVVIGQSHHLPARFSVSLVLSVVVVIREITEEYACGVW